MALIRIFVNSKQHWIYKGTLFLEVLLIVCCSVFCCCCCCLFVCLFLFLFCVSPWVGFPSPLVHDLELQRLAVYQDPLANSLASSGTYKYTLKLHFKCLRLQAVVKGLEKYLLGSVDQCFFEEYCYCMRAIGFLITDFKLLSDRLTGASSRSKFARRDFKPTLLRQEVVSF